MCLARGLIFGVLAISKVLLLSSKTAHSIDLSHSGISIAALASLKKCAIGIASLNAVDRAMHSTSVVNRAILVCNFDFQMIGHLAYLITNPVLEHDDAESSATALSNQPAKSASTKTSKPLLLSGSYINPLSSVPSEYLPILLMAISCDAFGSFENLAA